MYHYGKLADLTMESYRISLWEVAGTMKSYRISLWEVGESHYGKLSRLTMGSWSDLTMESLRLNLTA